MYRRNLASTLTMAACGVMTGCFWNRQPKVTQVPPPPQPTETKTPSARRRPARKSTVAQQHRPAATDAAPERESSSSEENASGLAEILTPQEAEDLTRALNQSLSSARRTVSTVSQRPLTADQMQTVKLVLAFVSQAEQARQSDLPLAAQLAHRAEVLADSLIRPNQ